MHTLLFLTPGHFHAALTLREAHPRVADEVFVYAGSEGEVGDFLSLVDRFNGRSERPTRWRPVVLAGADPLERLLGERRGDVVVLAGRNGGKARTLARLHAAGLHVLADKPWLVEPADLRHVEESLAGWPLVMEIMTGRHDLSARWLKRLVDASDVFGELRATGTAAVELASDHQLDKLVDGAPLRRPPWFFDVRVQGSGVVDIPTHVVDQTQWLVENTGAAPGEIPALIAGRGWSTPVPLEAFRRITGEAAFPDELRGLVERDELAYFCNVELEYRIGAVTARATSCWRLSGPDGGDTHRIVARGTRADLVLERGRRRRLIVQPHGDAARLPTAMRRELPGASVAEVGEGRYELTIPAGLDPGHESHFARVLDEFLTTIDDRRWPADLADRTLAKYAFLAEAAARIRPGRTAGSERVR
jgi:predicted dehydrogenase